jgi:hypothetical protein
LARSWPLLVDINLGSGFPVSGVKPTRFAHPEVFSS